MILTMRTLNLSYYPISVKNTDDQFKKLHIIKRMSHNSRCAPKINHWATFFIICVNDLPHYSLSIDVLYADDTSHGLAGSLSQIGNDHISNFFTEV